MTETTTPARAIQLRGHCQRCGREQAVVRGAIAKHGYDVEHGYFRGACSGWHYQPVELSRVETDAMIQTLRQDAVNMRALAEQYRTGAAKPARAKSGGPRVHDPITRTLVDATVPFAEAPEHFQRDAVRYAAVTADNRAQSADSHAGILTRIADTYHGKPLATVRRADAPAPIQCGERRLMETNGSAKQLRTVSATRVGRGHVAWRDDAGRVGRTSTRAWRLLQLVPAA